MPTFLLSGFILLGLEMSQERSKWNTVLLQQSWTCITHSPLPCRVCLWWRKEKKCKSGVLQRGLKGCVQHVRLQVHSALHYDLGLFGTLLISPSASVSSTPTPPHSSKSEEGETAEVGKLWKKSFLINVPTLCCCLFSLSHILCKIHLVWNVWVFSPCSWAAQGSLLQKSTVCFFFS